MSSLGARYRSRYRVPRALFWLAALLLSAETIIGTGCQQTRALYAEAMFNLGVMYATGQGVAQDYQEALRWYRKSAEAGNANAMTNLGVMYKDGLGVAQDDQEALRWYRKAASLGSDAAKKRLNELGEQQ